MQCACCVVAAAAAAVAASDDDRAEDTAEYKCVHFASKSCVP